MTLQFVQINDHQFIHNMNSPQLKVAFTGYTFTVCRKNVKFFITIISK